MNFLALYILLLESCLLDSRDRTGRSEREPSGSQRASTKAHKVLSALPCNLDLKGEASIPMPPTIIPLTPIPPLAKQLIPEIRGADHF